jgi:hypothetical protein
MGIGGTVPISYINNCGLAFRLEKSVHIELLDYITILRPIITPLNFSTIFQIPSLLGMDFIRRYKIQFDELTATLQK